MAPFLKYIPHKNTNMRKLIMICAAASIFAACNSKSDLDTTKDVITTDTSSLLNSNVSTDTATVVPGETAPPAVVPQTKTITKTRTVYVDRPATSNAPTQPQSNNTGVAPAAGTTGTGTTGTGTTTPAAKQKGWSNSTKGAVIGGAAGAVGGAIISKKKGTGAIIGGVIGAAGGYILGKKKDKAQADTLK
jgi:hypothetical protein